LLVVAMLCHAGYGPWFGHVFGVKTSDVSPLAITVVEQDSYCRLWISCIFRDALHRLGDGNTFTGAEFLIPLRLKHDLRVDSGWCSVAQVTVFVTGLVIC
jgi:hypothetical protein